MFGKYTYFVYTLIFTLPGITFLWVYYFPILKKNSKSIIISTAIAVLYGSLIWPYALIVRVWAYNYTKLLGLTILGIVVEDILWWAYITILLTSFLSVAISKQKTNQPILRRKE